MNIGDFVNKGVTLDNVLYKVKQEYAAEVKKQNAEKAEKMKKDHARAALMKAWRDYILVVAKELSPAEVDKILKGIEKDFESFEKIIAAGVRKPTKATMRGCSDEEILEDFLRGLDYLF